MYLLAYKILSKNGRVFLLNVEVRKRYCSLCNVQFVAPKASLVASPKYAGHQ